MFIGQCQLLCNQHKIYSCEKIITSNILCFSQSCVPMKSKNQILKNCNISVFICRCNCKFKITFTPLFCSPPALLWTTWLCNSPIVQLCLTNLLLNISLLLIKVVYFDSQLHHRAARVKWAIQPKQPTETHRYLWRGDEVKHLLIILCGLFSTSKPFQASDILLL